MTLHLPVSAFRDGVLINTASYFVIRVLKNENNLFPLVGIESTVVKFTGRSCASAPRLYLYFIIIIIQVT